MESFLDRVLVLAAKCCGMAWRGRSLVKVNVVRVRENKLGVTKPEEGVLEREDDEVGADERI